MNKVSSGNALENFQNYLFERNIIQEMDHDITSDPNANCDILFDELSNAKQLHMPTERVKFSKRKHKVQPWMNNVLLKKINKKSDKYSKLLKISKTDANYAAKKLSLMNMLKALKMTLKLRSAIIIFMCLTYTKIISNKPGIQFL